MLRLPHVFRHEAKIVSRPAESVGFDALPDVTEDGHAATGDAATSPQKILPHCSAAVFRYKPDIQSFDVPKAARI